MNISQKRRTIISRINVKKNAVYTIKLALDFYKTFLYNKIKQQTAQ